MVEVSERRVVGGRRAVVIAAAAGAGAMLLWLLGLLLNPRQALFSYLAAFAYVASLALGTLVFLLIAHAMGARWPVAVRRLMEAVVAALPGLALLFLPILLGAGYLYPWVELSPELGEHERHLVEHKQPYLNLPFFAVRAVLFFAVWIVAAELLRRGSLARERAARDGDGQDPGDPALARAMARDRALSAGMLPAMALALTFAAYDWLMSLQPTWFSAAYGVYYFAGGFLGGLALLIVLAFTCQRAGVLGPEITRFHFHALGRLLLAFVMFWAYIGFFQAMLIQISNKPDEVTFYVSRIEGSWMAVTYFLIIGHFALPFLLLLPRGVKMRPRVLVGIAGWLLAVHYVDVYWMVLPMLHEGGISPHWLDLAALIAVGGLSVALCMWRQRGLSALPEGDPRLAEALSYRSGE